MARRRTLKAVLPPESLHDDYRRTLGRLIREMRDDTEAQIEAAYRSALSTSVAQDAAAARPYAWIEDIIRDQSARWRRRFDDLAEQIASGAMGRVSGSNRRRWVKALKDAGFQIDFRTTGDERRLLRSLIRQNVSLIKSIPREHHNRVRRLVEESLDKGRDVTSLREGLSERFGVTERRAATIARTEINRAFEGLSRQRMNDIGVTHGRWMHLSGSKEPRITHKGVMNGKTFKLSEGLYDPDRRVRRKIQPGELINCRCTFKPIVDTASIEESE